MEQIQYELFDIVINPWSVTKALYPTHVVKSPIGEARSELAFASLAPNIIASLKSLSEVVLAGRSESLNPTERIVQVRHFGSLLFDSLISGDIRSCFDSSLMLVRKEKMGLRIRLRIEPLELRALPWELMRDSRSTRTLALSNFTPIVRYVELQQTILPLDVAYPLNFLIVVATPIDQPHLNVELEVQQINKALDNLIRKQSVKITVVTEATLLRVLNLLRKEQYHILHFIGHGQFSLTDQEGYLIFENHDRTSHLVNGTRLGQLLHDEPSLRLVVLNSCNSSSVPQSNSFVGVANSVVQAGVPAVLAMQSPITDTNALQFSQVFYESIADGFPIDTAVTEGRKALDILVENGVEWAFPQLSMRAQDGMLFRLKGHRDNTSTAVPKPRPVPATLQFIDSTPPPEETTPASISTSAPWDNMILIPAGSFIFGNGKAIHLPDFYIDRCPVTNEEYRRFLIATKNKAPASWPRGQYPVGQGDHPVTKISWHNANGYAQWIGKRLPTAQEWEKAARGTDGRLYPWGNTFDSKNCNFVNSGHSTTTSVGYYAAGASPYGVLDTVGNVWEWTLDEKPPLGLGNKEPLRVLKGGSWKDGENGLVCTSQSNAKPSDERDNIGFRCAKDL